MINLTKEDYEVLRKMGKITNEGYIFPNPQNREQVIKVIEPKISEPAYLEIKKRTIKRLLENYDYIRELNIAFPQETVTIEDEKRGYAASKICGIDLACSLSNTTIPLDNKINWLKQIGSLLINMGKIRQKYPHLSNFFYNDIHEHNFIITFNEVVYGIDPDSCSIQDNIPIRGMYSMYLNKGEEPGYKKYHQCPQICESAYNITPDENLDLYCYIRIILNFISGTYIPNLNPEILNNYLNYLESCGANLELLYCLASIHDDGINNQNPHYLLEYIKEIYQYSNIRYDKTGTLSRILR